MEFEWDADKSARNLTAHGVSFAEAATVFGDPLAITFGDPDHSIVESRYLTFGSSVEGRLLVVSHTDRRGIARESSALVRRHAARGSFMKKDKPAGNDDEARPEYHREQLGDGVRGKHLERYRRGTNLALLEPDVRAAYPTDESVNEALRSLLHDQ
jgi:uncharacterized DUF497 family protein